MGSPPSQPDFTSQDATEYPTAIDDAVAAAKRVAHGFAVYGDDAGGPPGMRVHIHAGAILSPAGALVAQGTQTIDSIPAPTGGNSRIDRIVADRVTGAAERVAGTAAPTPSAPAVPAGKWPLARVSLGTGQTSILHADVTDERVLWAASQAPTGAANQISVSGGGEISIHDRAYGVVGGINTQTGGSYTLVLADAGRIVERNSGSPNTVTVPPESSVAWGSLPRPAKIDIVQIGAGTTTIQAGSGVTIHSINGLSAIAGRYGGATLYRRAENVWVLLGALG